MKTFLKRIRNNLHARLDQAANEREAEIKRLREAVTQKNSELNALRKQLAEQRSATAQINRELSGVRAEAQRERRVSAAAQAAARHELEKARRELDVAQAENRRLWEVYERDHARVLKERALFDRQRADAETAMVLSRHEE